MAAVHQFIEENKFLGDKKMGGCGWLWVLVGACGSWWMVVVGLYFITHYKKSFSRSKMKR